MIISSCIHTYMIFMLYLNVYFLGVIDKYSHFVEYPVFLNGSKVNTFEPLWAKESQNLDEKEVSQFYKFFFKDYSDPLFHLAYKTDSPINIRSLLFAPRISPFEQLHQTESEIALYSRKVLISNKCKDILPKWMRFMKGNKMQNHIAYNIFTVYLYSFNLYILFG